MQIAQICRLEERIHRLGASIHIAKLLLKCARVIMSYSDIILDLMPLGKGLFQWSLFNP
jgi:hypothetical protein